MRIITEICPFCKEETKQTAVVESWLHVSGYAIFVHYWRKCLNCGEMTLEKIKEIECEQL